jgi:hypothetical protein
MDEKPALDQRVEPQSLLEHVALAFDHDFFRVANRNAL